MIAVDPEPVKRAATSLSSQQDGGRRKVTLDDPVAAAAKHSGWQASTANVSCVKAWRDRLHELGNAARSAAEELTASMDSYISTDGSVAKEMTTYASWLRNA